MWNEFLNDPPFHLSLLGSQRVAYVAFYNAYEAFLIIDCLKFGKGLLRLRTTDSRNSTTLCATRLARTFQALVGRITKSTSRDSFAMPSAIMAVV